MCLDRYNVVYNESPALELNSKFKAEAVSFLAEIDINITYLS